MKRIIALFLCLLTALSFAACAGSGSGETTGGETVDTYNYPQINQTLSWNAINAFPIKSEDMTVAEMRQLCVDFFRFSKTAVWTPNDNMQYSRNASGTVDEIVKGIVYGGLPYVGQGGCCSIYRLMDYYNEETGVVNMERVKAFPALFGNHCSSASYWAWGRVINSVGHGFTFDMLHSKGYLRIGPYTYDDSITRFSANYTSDMICAENGMETMFQSYAQLHLADGLVNYHSGGGHVIMCSCEPHVEYIEGTDQIDGANSYITIIEQGQNWKETNNESGDTFQMKNGVDTKRTFLQLFTNAYMPFTYAEFLGTDPVEETRCSIDLTGDSVTVTQLFNATVTANYGISDVYATVRDSDGREVYHLVTCADMAGLMELRLSKNSTASFSRGTLDVIGDGYTVEISCQLSTGERPVLYSGKLLP